MINSYIDSKKYAWAPSTLRSERYRLLAVAPFLNGNPEHLWQKIESLNPYARLTTWTRVCSYWTYLHPDKPNEYMKWRKDNARLFKNVYTKTKPNITYREAEEKIQTIKSTEVREYCLRLLKSGLRFNEGRSAENSQIIGKGGKSRPIYEATLFRNSGASYWRVRRELKRLGLRPHDLRKVFLSRLVELGANPFELAEIAGWSSIETAASYIKLNSDRLKSLVEEVRK